ncbi:hypothetical protein OC861_003983 [Tilletia horrida]|nr:hypothetical protein OC861_003983 [Tilletia horrida]
MSDIPREERKEEEMDQQDKDWQAEDPDSPAEEEEEEEDSINEDGLDADTLLTQLRELAPTAGSYLDTVVTHLDSILESARASPSLQGRIEKFAIFVSHLFLQVAKQEQQNPQSRIAPGSYAHLIIIDLLRRLSNARHGLGEFAEMSEAQQRVECRGNASHLATVRNAFRVCVPILKHFIGRHDDEDQRTAFVSRFQNPLKDISIRHLLQDAMEQTEQIDGVLEKMPPPFETIQILYDCIDAIQPYEGAQVRRFPIRSITSLNDTEQAAAELRQKWASNAAELLEDFLNHGEAAFGEPEFLSNVLDMGVMEVWAHRPQAAGLYFLIIAADARRRLEEDPASDAARITLTKALSAAAAVEHMDQALNTYDVATEAVQVMRPLFEKNQDLHNSRVMAAAVFQVANKDEEGNARDDGGECQTRSISRLDAAQEAVRLYTLALETDSTNMALKASLARSYRALAIRQDENDQFESSKASIGKAIALFRELVAYMPPLHTIQLAGCLETLAENSGEGNEGQARNFETTMKEAISLLESMARAWPLSTLRHLYLLNLSLAQAINTDQDRLDGATDPATKALKYCKAYAEHTESDQNFTLGFLHNLRASIWISLENWHEGLADAEESIRWSRFLEEEDDSVQSVIAAATSNVAWCEWMLGKDERVVSRYEESIKTLETVLEDNPSELVEELSIALARLSGAHLWLGNHELALETSSRAVHMARYGIGAPADQLAAPGEDDLSITPHTLGYALTFLAGAYFAKSQFEDAVKASAEAVEVMEEALTTVSKRKTTLLLHIRCLEALGRAEEAAAVKNKADNMPLLGYADKIGIVKYSSRS